MPPRFLTVVLLAPMALLACSEPALREPETRPGTANQAGGARANSANRPVQTVGPDDAVPRRTEAIEPVEPVERVAAAPIAPPTETASATPPPAGRATPGPPPQ